MRDRTKKIFANLAAKFGDLSNSYSSDELGNAFEDSGSEYSPSEEGTFIIIFVIGLVLGVSNNVFILFLISDVESNDENERIQSKQKCKFPMISKNYLAPEISGNSGIQTVFAPRNTTENIDSSTGKCCFIIFIFLFYIWIIIIRFSNLQANLHNINN